MQREDGLHEIIQKYTIKTTKIPTKPGFGDHTLVEIFCDNNKIGEYQRNYSCMFNTFLPFIQNGKEYALYSKCYTTTRVMELPSCKDICGEESDTFGFCPTGYFVPYTDQPTLDDKIENWKEDIKEYFEKIIGPNGQFGFVCGCVWGDDTSWKIQFLDLSKISEGILIRDDRFGYLELSQNLSSSELHKIIHVNDFTEEQYINGNICINISSKKPYDLKGKIIEW